MKKIVYCSALLALAALFSGCNKDDGNEVPLPAKAVVTGDNVIAYPATSVVLTATAENAVTYVWYKNGAPVPNEVQNTLTVTEAGSYTAAGVNETGEGAQSDPKVVTVVELPLPAKAAVTGDDVIVCPATSVVLTAAAENAVTYVWYKNGSPVPNEVQNTLTVTEAGTYTAAGVNEKGESGAQSDPKVVTLITCPIVLPTDGAYGVYWGDYYENGTSNYSLSFDDFGTGPFLYLDVLTADRPTSVDELGIAPGTYPVNATLAANTVIVDDYGISKGGTQEDGTTVTSFFVTGGTVEVARSGNDYIITANLSRIDATTEQPIADERYSFTGPIEFYDFFGEFDEGGDLAYEELLGAYTATGTPSVLSTPGTPTWASEIQQGGSDFYKLTNFGNRDINIWIDVTSDGVLTLDDYTKVAGNASYDGYLKAGYINGDDIYWVPGYEVHWDADTKTLDMSGTVEGFDVFVCVAALSPTDGAFGGLFVDGYTDLKFVQTSASPGSVPFSVSGKKVDLGTARLTNLQPLNGKTVKEAGNVKVTRAPKITGTKASLLKKAR